MASLESKLLDGKCVGYCSSSEGEDEDENGFKPVTADDDAHQAKVMKQMGGTGQTGAKGVLKDYEEYQRMKTIKAVEANRKNMERAKKGMLTSNKEEREAAEEEEKEEEEEDTLEMLRRMRMNEMKKAAQGRVVELPGKMELLSTIEDTKGLLIVLLYEEPNDGTIWSTHLLRLLASSFSHIRVARITATTAGMSTAFIQSGVPALQVYCKGDLVANLVPLQSHIGEDGQLPVLLSTLRRKGITLRKNRILYDGESDIDSSDEDY